MLNDLLEAGNVAAVDESFVAEAVNNALSRYKDPRHKLDSLMSTDSQKNRYKGHPNTKRCPIHCEDTLVQHKHPHSSPMPLYTYIGVSKLSCPLCHLFLQEFGKETGKMFKTKGTHSKIYYPWGFPRLGNKALKGRL